MENHKSTFDLVEWELLFHQLRFKTVLFLNFRIFWIVVLVSSVSVCYILTSQTYNNFRHPISISLDQPTSVDKVPFPAITFMEPFGVNEEYLKNFNFFWSRFVRKMRPKVFEYLEETDQVDVYMAEVMVCEYTNLIYDYPFVGYEKKITEVLLNKSLDHLFDTQEALWNSQFEVVVAKRLTSQGFGYSFNILAAEELLNLEE